MAISTGALGAGPLCEETSLPSFPEARSMSADTNISTKSLANADGVDSQGSFSMSRGNTSENDDDDLTPIEYAARYGLITKESDWNATDPLGICSMSNVLLADLESADLFNETDHFLEKLAVAHHALDKPERWDIDSSVAHFMANIFGMQEQTMLDDVCRQDAPHSLSKLKMEPRILSTDPEADLAALRARNRLKTPLQEIQYLGLDGRKVKLDAWSAEILCAPNKVQMLLEGEKKLNVDNAAATYLNDICQPEQKPEVQCDLASLDSKTMRLPQRQSPPLLPLSPSLEPNLPSDGVLDVHFTSEPEDLEAKEAACIAQHLMQRDSGTFLSGSDTIAKPQAGGVEQISHFHTDLYPLDTSSCSPLRHKSFAALRAETPLIPQVLLELPAELPQKIPCSPDLIKACLLDSDTNSSGAVAQDSESSIITRLRPFADSTKRSIGKEQLVEFDTTMRVPVPDIEQATLLPPWQSTTGQTDTLAIHQRVVLELRKELELKRNAISSIERLLPWTPFPASLGAVNIDETLDDGLLTEFLADLSFTEDIDFEGLTWKPDGLRLFDAHDSDDEELVCFTWDKIDGLHAVEPMDTNVATMQAPASAESSKKGAHSEQRSGQIDLRALLKKRKLELHGARDIAGPCKRSMQVKHFNTEDEASAQRTTDSGDGLASFLRLHGRPVIDSNLTADPQISTHQPAPKAVMVPPAEVRTARPSKTNGLPAPDIVNPDLNRSVIIFTRVSANRDLVRQLQRALPALELVERDDVESSQNLVAESLRAANLHEADLTVSPSTGIVLTTLQIIKQKPLPGQSSFFGVRRRIQAITTRYERVIVLVHASQHVADGQSTHASTFDETDTKAVSDLIGFTAVLNGDIQVRCISGNEQYFASWIATYISLYATSNSDIRLLHDETLWERFLRHAGLNAFAAQAILSRLKLTSDLQHASASVPSIDTPMPLFGLATFAQMTAQQRLERFSDLLGGDRSLQDISRIFENPWMSVSAPKQ